MLTQESQPGVPADAGPQGPGQKVRISRFTPAGLMTVAGAAAAALGLVWVLYERVLPLSGVLGFWLSWYVVFLLFYVAMARIQWDWREVSHRLATVAFVTGGARPRRIRLRPVVFSLLPGPRAVSHSNFHIPALGLG